VLRPASLRRIRVALFLHPAFGASMLRPASLRRIRVLPFLRPAFGASVLRPGSLRRIRVALWLHAKSKNLKKKRDLKVAISF
jgi:hypothetical protein